MEELRPGQRALVDERPATVLYLLGTGGRLLYRVLPDGGREEWATPERVRALEERREVGV